MSGLRCGAQCSCWRRRKSREPFPLFSSQLPDFRTGHVRKTFHQLPSRRISPGPSGRMKSFSILLSFDFVVWCCPFHSSYYPHTYAERTPKSQILAHILTRVYGSSPVLLVIWPDIALSIARLANKIQSQYENPEALHLRISSNEGSHAPPFLPAHFSRCPG